MVTVISSNTIFISWSELPCEFHYVLSLEVIILIADVELGGSQVEHRVPRNLSSAVLTGLNPVTTYTIVVALSNSNGTGPYSVPIRVTTLTPISGAVCVQVHIVNKVSFPYCRSLGHHNSCILNCSWFLDSVSLSHFISDTCMCYQMEVSQRQMVTVHILHNNYSMCISFYQ